MKTTTEVNRKNAQDYRIETSPGVEVIVKAVGMSQALSIFLKRGRRGMSASWCFTRQPDGWVVARNTDGRQLERKFYKLREVNWDRDTRSVGM